MTEQGKRIATRGFTIVELLTVIVIIGILAGIAVPKYLSMKERAHMAEEISDLRNTTTAQESYFHDHNVYASNSTLLYPSFQPTAGNTLTIFEATTSGWSAKITSDHTSIVCAVFFSAAPVAPATADGVAACQ